MVEILVVAILAIVRGAIRFLPQMAVFVDALHSCLLNTEAIFEEYEKGGPLMTSCRRMEGPLRDRHHRTEETSGTSAPPRDSRPWKYTHSTQYSAKIFAISNCRSHSMITLYLKIVRR